MLFLGEAANYKGRTFKHLFARGNASDREALKSTLAKRYISTPENVYLTVNGRSAIAIALKSFLEPGSEVIVTGFTCHAVIEALKNADCIPIFADIDKSDLNFSVKTVENLLKSHKIRAIIIQNTLGNPCDIADFEKLAKKHHLYLIEDLAHSVGRVYPDGREVGTVGDATCLSFGKGKAIDTITGGALILRKTPIFSQKEPQTDPKKSADLRARWYPVFGGLLRALYRVHLNKPLAFILLKLHFIERSADSPLDTTRRLSDWQAHLANEALKKQRLTKKPLREFYLVKNRESLLLKLHSAGYIFDEFWYEVPISPARYYQKYKTTIFDEESCPIATEVATEIINLPTHYPKNLLYGAEKIIKEHIDGQLE